MQHEKISSNKCFGGQQQRWRHYAESLGCEMQVSVYIPPGVSREQPAPVVYWLSGLTCTDENFTHKAGAQRIASELGLVLVIPDTSPRGDGVPDAPDGAYDLGLGAGFYVNATQAPWQAHYQMYDYIVSELPQWIESQFPVTERRAISGHSMGGHGALVIGLRNPERYRSISAFSPIVNPSQVPWGQKALRSYLGDDRSAWQEYDACALLKQAKTHLPLLVDQGSEDEFLELQLTPHKLQAAAEAAGYPVIMRMQSGYDHSYYFIASFIEQHLRFHAKYLR